MRDDLMTSPELCAKGERTPPDTGHGTGHAVVLERSVMMQLHPAPTVRRGCDPISPDGVIGISSDGGSEADATFLEAAAMRAAGLLDQISENYG